MNSPDEGKENIPRALCVEQINRRPTHTQSFRRTEEDMQDYLVKTALIAAAQDCDFMLLLFRFTVLV